MAVKDEWEYHKQHWGEKLDWRYEWNLAKEYPPYMFSMVALFISIISVIVAAIAIS